MWNHPAFLWFGMVLVTVFLSAQSSDARREILSPEQKARLEQLDRIHIDVIAITDQGSVDAEPVRSLVARRLQQIGYAVVTDSQQSGELLFRVKCEQRKVWEGTQASGGDADLPDSPSRVWKGPACQLTYLLDGKKSGWRKEVRTDFADAVAAAEQAKAPAPGTYALTKLLERLDEYDFPVRLAAELGQDERLLKLLDVPDSTPARKVLIINLLGEMFSTKAVPRLLTALKDQDKDIAKASALALGNIGSQDGIPALADLLKSGTPELQLSAARALGVLGALHGDYAIIPPLLEALKTQDLAVKTEVVYALGKLPDRRSYEPLRALQTSLRGMRTSDRASTEGKLWDALSYSLKQIDTFDQLN